MSQHLLQLIQSGATAEFATAVADNPSLMEWKDVQGVSALLWSVYLNQPIIRDYLLSLLPDIDIFEAAAVGDAARIAGHLLDAPWATSSYSPDGWTPLHLASAFGNPDTVTALLDGEIEIDAVSKNPQRSTPLHACLGTGKNLQIAEILLEQGANPDARQVRGFTPLILAAIANRRDLVDLLLNYGANPLLPCDWGKTAAAYAKERGYEDLSVFLHGLKP